MTRASTLLLSHQDALARACAALTFAAPVAATYVPTVYARPLIQDYYEKYVHGAVDVVLMGMNPGPWGMAQTGIPFGEVRVVRDWLKLRGDVHQPKTVHPKRPVLGLDCTRSEVSGARLWGAIAQRYPSAEAFFQNHFVLNYCPILFLDESARNITPEQLGKTDRERIALLCDAHLRQVLRVLSPRVVVGVGRYAHARASAVCQGTVVRTALMPHPSPANPKANHDYVGQARHALAQADVHSVL